MVVKWPWLRIASATRSAASARRPLQRMTFTCLPPMVTRTGTRSAERHPAAAHASHHSLHAAHHALHAAAAQLAHHLFHLLVLLHQLVDVGRGHEIGRASCRERVCQYVKYLVVAG